MEVVDGSEVRGSSYLGDWYHGIVSLSEGLEASSFHLVDRVRRLIGSEPEVTPMQRFFGGSCEEEDVEGERACHGSSLALVKVIQNHPCPSPFYNPLVLCAHVVVRTEKRNES